MLISYICFLNLTTLRKSLFIISLVFSCSINAQSIFRIYFEYGKTEPKIEQIEKFNKWFEKLDYNQIDSIVLVGFADSVGKIENNIKLSLKRTEYIKKNIKKNYFDRKSNLDIRQYGKGEKNKKIEDKDRRVEIRVYLKPPKLEDEVDSVGIEVADNKCYIVDYEMLQTCFVSYTNIKNRRYVKLYMEKEDYLLYKKIPYFYYTYDSSKIILNKVRWKSKTSGIKSFQRPRYETLIPLESYLKNKVVYYEPKSCDSCFKDTLIGLAYLGKSICMAEDIFLNRNVEWKPRFLNPFKVAIRVPKMFTDSSLTYYKMDGQAIAWKIKKRKPEYHYAVFNTFLSYNHYYFSKIYRKKPCCFIKNHKLNSGGFVCGGVRYSYKSNIILEVGFNRLNKENLPYIGLAFNTDIKKIETRLLTGIDLEIRPILGVKLQKSIFKLPLSFLYPSFYVWKRASNATGRIPNPNTFEVLTGTEARFGFNIQNNGFAEQIIFAGLRVFSGRHQIFLQKGLSYRYHGQYASDFYSSFQIGYYFLVYKIH